MKQFWRYNILSAMVFFVGYLASFYYSFKTEIELAITSVFVLFLIAVFQLIVSIFASLSFIKKQTIYTLFFIFLLSLIVIIEIILAMVLLVGARAKGVYGY
ncbi:hypothetical protein [Capnocytophaga catalasegens]|uniref:hypothetical protein n=1 Tax=Capnocytophaga catalasegens TaxID=1004260 RepID=UPI002231C6AC|nr:hypothetical protein [Capnocytophaga catalasegens]